MKPILAIEQTGAVIAGRYRVEQLLGRGGMSVVYRVLDERANKQVALKRCSPVDPNKQAHYGALLQREYHTLAQLAHPHIIVVHDFGIDPRGPYYTMELLDGSDLQQIDRLPWGQACVALHDVLSALALLHSRGLLHRDVSMRNVHWSPQARAKLIDFGAMVTMGVAKHVVGTPPFVAPEALQLQALDARTDIFSVGALGYRLLTGQHAFAVRQFSELRDAWRSKPAPPSRFAPELPAELSALILRMLSVDRGGRPHSAGEIIEQLRALARIEREDTAQVSRGYLTTPVLVGREAAQLDVRKQILALVRGDGGMVLFRGVQGTGRSRMLDACVLEGKLLGAAVVRADARDAVRGEWGVLRAIGSQLLEQFPKSALEAARLSRDVLGHVLEDPRADESHTMTGFTPERGLIIRELRDWLLSLCKLQRLLIVIDDLERVDESSLAVLVAVAHKAKRHPLLIAASVVADLPLSGTLQTLCEVATHVELEHLRSAETEALLRSVFGDVANLQTCAGRIHGLSHGNPRAVMELAQHLCDTGRAKYESGSWVLPQALDESDLPSSLTASMLARLDALGPDARELAELLALTDEDGLVISSYVMLTRRGNAGRLFRALDDLVAARIVITDGERCHFTQRGFIAVLHDALPDERRRKPQARIARFLSEAPGDPFRLAHHLLGAGQDAPAIELLDSIDLNARNAPSSLLAKAIERAEATGVPASTLNRLRMGLLISAPLSMDYDNFRRVAPVVLARLERDCGLVRYRELVDLPESERLAQAIAQTQQAYLATPPAERVYTVLEAIRELAKLMATIPAVAVPMFDRDMRNALPDISPLYPLSPSLPIVGRMLEGMTIWGRGRYREARAVYEELLARIAEPDRGGFDEAQHQRIRYGLQLMLATFEAASGIERAEHRAKLFEQQRSLRVNAWRIRSLLQLAIGNTIEATKCMRRAELLQVQEGLNERFVNSTMAVELTLRSRLGDLLGVKSQLPILASLAAHFEGWRPVEFLGRSRYCQLQGDLETALELALAGLELVKPLGHPFFTSLAASHIELLDQLGRTEQAVAATDRYLALYEQHQLSDIDVPLRAAIVLARAGQCERAARVLEPHIAEAEQLGRVGFAAGAIYEARARVAIAAGDAASFQSFADRCAHEYEKSQNPALGARLSELVEAGRQRGLAAGDAANEIRKSLQPAALQDEYETLHNRIEECVSPADRARCALTLLLQNTFSNLGYLYLTREGRTLALAATLPDEPNDPGVGEWVERHARAWIEAAQQRDESATQTEDIGSQSGEATDSVTENLAEATSFTGSADLFGPELASSYVDLEGRQLQMVLLVRGSGSNSALAGLLVVQATPGRPAYLPQLLTSAIATELLRYGDAKDWNFEEARAI